MWWLAKSVINEVEQVREWTERRASQMELIVMQQVQEARTTGTTQCAVSILEKILIVVCFMEYLIIFGRMNADIKPFHVRMRRGFKIKDLGKFI